MLRRGIVIVLTVDLPLFTQLGFSCRCYTVRHQFSVMSRFLTLSPVTATVLVIHWIRFVSWLKVQVVVVCLAACLSLSSFKAASQPHRFYRFTDCLEVLQYRQTQRESPY